MTQPGFTAAPQEMRARARDLFVLRDEFTDLGRATVASAEALPGNAFGQLPESTVAASALHTCARSVAASDRDTMSDLDNLGGALKIAASAYHDTDTSGADRLR